MKETTSWLITRIRDEVGNLTRVVARVQRGWQQALSSADDLYLDSVALNLYGFYAGLERVFELVATKIDESIIPSEQWHKGRLDQMAREIAQVRPSVISTETHELLNNYRSFHNLVRNVHALNLYPTRMKDFVENLPSVWDQTRAELLVFAKLLETNKPTYQQTNPPTN